MSPPGPRENLAVLGAALAGLAYLLAVQLAFLSMPFTDEVLWVWALRARAAAAAGRLDALLLDPEWWFGLAVPASVLVTGSVGAYAYIGDRNPVPGLLAAGFLAGLFTTEVVFAGRFEWALLYLLASPVVAAVAVVTHLAVDGAGKRPITRRT